MPVARAGHATGKAAIERQGADDDAADIFTAHHR